MPNNSCELCFQLLKPDDKCVRCISCGAVYHLHHYDDKCTKCESANHEPFQPDKTTINDVKFRKPETIRYQNIKNARFEKKTIVLGIVFILVLFIAGAAIIDEIVPEEEIAHGALITPTQIPVSTPTNNVTAIPGTLQLPTKSPNTSQPTLKPSVTMSPTPKSLSTKTPKPTRIVSTRQPNPTSTRNSLFSNNQPSNPAKITCRGAPSTRLNVGYRARVTYTDGTPGSVRSAAASASIIGKVPEGVGMDIVGGPRCDNSIVWWRVKTDNGYKGWMSEGNPSEYWLEPSN